ncbi:MAG: AzlD domain-containing protein [Clostridia bacterium]|nr:AzlD domain-containing protein [Clostridia bacterium]MBR2973359.1 AzlD domain-containing protein [Clostridia bacterium]MBR3577151.1 AzlD domain-containing protein [Clostridia bacterium]
MNFFVYLIAMAGVTYLIRMIPFTFMRKKIKSVFIRSFLYYVPYAVLGAMTFPYIFYSTGSIITASAGAAAALVLAYFNKSLITVAVCSSVVAFITGLII